MVSRLKKWANGLDIVVLRRWVQVVFFVLLVWGGGLALNVGNSLPTFACVFDQTRGGSCYLMGFQHQMATPWPQYLSGRGIGMAIGLATFIGVFLLINKAWCGWCCPLGAVQDWLTLLRGKIGIRPGSYREETYSRLKTIKYVLLVLLILLPMAMGNSFFGLPKLDHDFAVPFCMICPGRTVLPLFSGDISQLAIDFSSTTKMVLTTLGMLITGVFLIGALIKKRFICLFCPMSAFHYLFHKAGLLRLTKDGHRCTRCGNCSRACDMDIRAIADDLESKNIVTDDCMMCLKCVAVCPEEGCLRASWLGLPVYEASTVGFFKRMSDKKYRTKTEARNSTRQRQLTASNSQAQGIK